MTYLSLGHSFILSFRKINELNWFEEKKTMHHFNAKLNNPREREKLIKHAPREGER